MMIFSLDPRFSFSWAQAHGKGRTDLPADVTCSLARSPSPDSPTAARGFGRNPGSSCPDP